MLLHSAYYSASFIGITIYSLNTIYISHGIPKEDTLYVTFFQLHDDGESTKEEEAAAAVRQLPEC